VVTYLWTKGVGAGAIALAGLAHILGIELGVIGEYVAPALALFGAATTGALLVWDLKRPERFLYIFLKSNWTSWIVLGAYVLAAFSGGAVLWLVAAFFGIGWLTSVLAWLALPASALMAGYTGFLFGQAEGRDLWQSPLLFWHLLVQALFVGVGALAVVLPFVDVTRGGEQLIVRTLVGAGLLHVLMLVLEFKGRHITRGAAAAAHMVTNGRYAATFWTVAVGGGLMSAALAAFAWSGLHLLPALAAGLLAQIALLVYESIFIRAGQDVPLS
jgi:formate-dependent nitrite reductase membrane component NrfD